MIQPPRAEPVSRLLRRQGARQLSRHPGQAVNPALTRMHLPHGKIRIQRQCVHSVACCRLAKPLRRQNNLGGVQACMRWTLGEISRQNHAAVGLDRPRQGLIRQPLAGILEQNVEDHELGLLLGQSLQQPGVKRAVPGLVFGLLQHAVRSVVQRDDDDLLQLQFRSKRKQQVVTGVDQALTQAEPACGQADYRGQRRPKPCANYMLFLHHRLYSSWIKNLSLPG